MTMEEKILKAFEEHQSFNRNDITDEFNISESYAKTTLSRLKAKNKVECIDKNKWRVKDSAVNYTINERKREVLLEQFEKLSELNEHSTDSEEIEERIKLMIRLAGLF